MDLSTASNIRTIKKKLFFFEKNGKFHKCFFESKQMVVELLETKIGNGRRFTFFFWLKNTSKSYKFRVIQFIKTNFSVL